MVASTKKSKKASSKKKFRKRPAGTENKNAPAQATLKLQIDLKDGSRLGPGKIMLLEAIDRAGSLSQGAAEMGISYRRAWLFVSQINDSFDHPAISTPASGHGGAPAQLTDFGRELIAVYRKLEADAERASSKAMTWVRNHSA